MPPTKQDNLSVTFVLLSLFWGVAVPAGSTPKVQPVQQIRTAIPQAPPRKPCNCASTEKQVRKALDNARQAFGPSSAEASFALTELGKTHLYQMKFSEAEKDLQEAVEIQKKTLEKNDSRTAFTLSLLASVYHEEGRSAESAEQSKVAMSIFEANMKAGKPLQMEALEQMARLYLYQKKLKEALASYEKALPIAEQRYKSAPNELAGRYETLSMLNRGDNNERAEDFLRKAVAARTQGKPPQPALLLWDKQQLGQLMILNKKYSQAVAYLDKETRHLDEGAAGSWYQTITICQSSLTALKQPVAAQRLVSISARLKPKSTIGSLSAQPSGDRSPLPRKRQ